MSDLTSVMELEKIPFSCKMKIKTVTKYIGEKKKSIDSILQDFIRLWTSEKYEKTFLTFFKVEVYSVCLPLSLYAIDKL